MHADLSRVLRKTGVVTLSTLVSLLVSVRFKDVVAHGDCHGM